MIVSGKIVSKLITGSGVFARVKLAGYNGGKNVMRFFDVPDEENFTIGTKVDIEVAVSVVQPASICDNFSRATPEEPLSWDLEVPGNYETLEIIPGFFFHAEHNPADVVGATGVSLDPPGCESPASDICLDEQGHQQL